MTTVWAIEIREGEGRRRKWRFSAAYPTKREAKAWAAYCRADLDKRLTKWVKA